VKKPLELTDEEECFIRNKLSGKPSGMHLNLHDLVMPIDLSSFNKLLKQFKCTTTQFHAQVDQTGGV
jgi:hypothetical protein